MKCELDAGASRMRRRCGFGNARKAYREADMAKPKFSNPAGLSKPPGYSHVVEVAGPARMIFVAGQLGLDLQNNLVGAPGDFRAQVTQAFENLKIALHAAGADFGDVVKITNYLTDMSHLPIFREVRDKYVNVAAPPASTTIQISKFARDGALFEIEAVAMVST
jgi:enamine deaminase RidA (YjgF/YER057c/UK114 family)